MLHFKIAFLFIFFTWPAGYLLLRSFRFRPDRSLLQFVILPPVFGIPVISLIYFAFRIFHGASFFFLAPLVLMLASLFLLYRSEASLDLLKSIREHWGKLLFAGLAYAVLMLFFSSYAGRIYHDPTGGFVIGDNAFDDHIWGVSVSAELQHRVPPMLPIFSGYKLQYHYLTDLFVEMLHRTSGTELRMFDFYYKFISPVLILWLLGTLFLVFMSYFKRFSLTVLAILLIMLLPPQLSFLYKHHYTLTVLFFNAAVYFLLNQYFLDNRPAFARAAFFLLGMLLLYDAIIGAVTLGAVILYAAFRSIKERRFSPILVYSLAAIALGASCMIALLGFPHSQKGAFALGDGVLPVAAKMRFRNLHRVLDLSMYFLFSPGNMVHEFFRNCLSWFSRVAVYIFTLFFPPAVSPVNYHFLAFPAVFKALRHPDKKHAVSTIAACCLVLAFFVSSFVIYKPSGPAASVLDRALLFLSIFLMPLTVQAIFSLWNSKRIWGKALLAGMGIVYLVLPTIRADAFIFRPGYYSYIDRASMETFDFIRNQTDPRSIILHPFHDNPIYRAGEPPQKPAMIFRGHYFFMSAIGERQTVFEGAVTSTTYFMGDLTYDDAVKRMDEVDRFYQTDDPIWARDFLTKLNVDYVWIPEDKPLRFRYEGFLSPVFQNEKNVLCAVVRT